MFPKGDKYSIISEPELLVERIFYDPPLQHTHNVDSNKRRNTLRYYALQITTYWPCVPLDSRLGGNERGAFLILIISAKIDTAISAGV